MEVSLHRNNPIVLSESRYGHQFRAWGAFSLIGYLVIPSIDVVNWSSPLDVVGVIVSLFCALVIVGYPLRWAYLLFKHLPKTSSLVMVGGGIATLYYAPDPSSTAAYAPYLVGAVILCLVPLARLLLAVTHPKHNTALELAHAKM